MTLIVEDGSVVANADSFLSLADARELAYKYGLSIATVDNDAEIQLRNAYLSLNNYEGQLQGYRVSSEQTGIFPRYGVQKDCYVIDSDVIPNEVKLAQMYQVDAVASGSYSNISVASGGRLASFEVVGAYKESYQDDSNTNLNATVQGVYNSLYPFTKSASCGGGYGNGLGREEFGFVGR